MEKDEINSIGELTRNMNEVYNNLQFYLHKRKIYEVKSVNDIIAVIPIIISNIELICKSIKGKDKKDIAKGVLSILVQKFVHDEELEKNILTFMNDSSDIVIDNLVYMANYGGKLFNKKSCCFKKWKK